MRKSMLLFVFLISVLICQGQTRKMFYLNILNPGIGVELPISQNNLLEFNAGMGINYSYRSFDASSKNYLQFLLTPFADVQAKHFYNFNKRNAAGKSTNFNSGNFIALKLFYDGDSFAGNVEPEVQQMIALGPAWGIQRSNGKFSFRGSAGPIVYGDFLGDLDFYPLNFTIHFGYVLGK